MRLQAAHVSAGRRAAMDGMKEQSTAAGAGAGAGAVDSAAAGPRIADDA